MQIHDLEAYAQQIFAEIGPRSVAVAARRGAEAVGDGNEDHAQRWHHIEQALISLRDRRRS